MRHLVYVFIPSALILLTAFRLAFALWQWPRVRQAGGLLPILIGGLRIDALMIAAFGLYSVIAYGVAQRRTEKQRDHSREQDRVGGGRRRLSGDPGPSRRAEYLSYRSSPASSRKRCLR